MNGYKKTAQSPVLLLVFLGYAKAVPGGFTGTGARAVAGAGGSAIVTGLFDLRL